jgi:hypothetical protein
MRKLCINEVGGVKIKKNEKNKKKNFVIQKNVFSLLLFFLAAFGFTLQR